LTRLVLSLLGSYQVTLEGRPVEAFESDKVRLLLAYLAVENDRSVPRGKLVGLFWPEQDEGRARGSLSQALYNLRIALGERPQTGELSGSPIPGASVPFLLVTPQTVQLNPLSDQQVDVSLFKALQASCARHPHHRLETCSECAHRLSQAALLYRGDLLDGFALRGCQEFEEWLLMQREALHQQAAETLFHLALYSEGQGDYKSALIHARRLVALEPLEEKAQRMLLRLLALDGQHAAALAGYQAFRNLLAAELGVEPEAETRALNARLQAETGTAQQPLMHLPASLTPLVGRRDELVELTALVRDPNTRLVTVLGPGGCGKTRLALEVTRSLRYDFPEGVFLVPLSGLPSEQSLLPAVASAVGVTFQEKMGDVNKQLFGYLSEKHLLLLLDSFEGVLAGAGWVSEMLHAAPYAQVLVTSRARLNARGEQVFILGGMRYPPADQAQDVLEYSAVQLFVAAAQRVKPDFEAEDMKAVVRICQAVAGMPLGLLLSAGWVGSYPVGEIAMEIERSLDFLTSEWRGVPERQQSLRATLDYSWGLLSEAECEAFRKLSVFRGMFSRQVAHQVCGIGPRLLRSLVDKSMLQMESNGLYRMHDLLHQYATEKLAQQASEADRLSQRHGSYYLGELPARGSDLKSARQRQALEQLDGMINDVQAAWEWAAGQGEWALLEGAVEGLCLYYNLRCRYEEGKSACRLAVENLGAATQTGNGRLSLRGWLLAWQANFCEQLGEVEQAKQLREAGWEVLGQAQAVGQDIRRVQALVSQTTISSATNLRLQLDVYLHSAALYQELDEPWWRARILISAGEVANRLGEHALGLKLHQEALELSREVGEPRRLGSALEFLAYDHLILGQWETGSRLMHEAADAFRAAGDLWAKANAELNLGAMLAWTGCYADARQVLESALPLLRQAGDRYNIMYGTAALGTCELEMGEYAQAVCILQTALESARRDGFGREEAFTLAMLGCVALAQGEVSQALTAMQEGVSLYRIMQFSGELGMALGGLALAQRGVGQAEPARAALQEALRIAVETKSRFTLLTLCAALVVLLLYAGKVELALQAYISARLIPMIANSRWFDDIAGSELLAKSELLSPEARQAAEQRGRGMDFIDLAAAVLAEMQ
jgi:DNA-binding SARP family transcriptional activator/predicted ATPase